jgi:hypothetical protein
MPRYEIALLLLLTPCFCPPRRQGCVLLDDKDVFSLTTRMCPPRRQGFVLIDDKDVFSLTMKVYSH